MAYSPSVSDSATASKEPILGWYYWTWKTEWEIDTWSYRRGWQDGWIPKDVGNWSTFVFPLLGNGCVDEKFGWEAPAQVGAAARGGMLSGWWSGAAIVAGLVIGTGLL